jgi:hypothetical protein
MKLIVAGILGLFTLTANAGGIDCRSGVDHKHPGCYGMVQVQHHHGHRHFHRAPPVVVYRDYNWVAPVVGGVILGAVINEAARPRVVEQPVIVQPVQPTQPVCTEWREVMQSDGTIAKERTCYQK